MTLRSLVVPAVAAAIVACGTTEPGDTDPSLVPLADSVRQLPQTAWTADEKEVVIAQAPIGGGSTLRLRAITPATGATRVINDQGGSLIGRRGTKLYYWTGSLGNPWTLVESGLDGGSKRTVTAGILTPLARMSGDGRFASEVRQLSMTQYDLARLDIQTGALQFYPIAKAGAVQGINVDGSQMVIDGGDAALLERINADGSNRVPLIPRPTNGDGLYQIANSWLGSDPLIAMERVSGHTPGPVRLSVEVYRGSSKIFTLPAEAFCFYGTPFGQTFTPDESGIVLWTSDPVGGSCVSQPPAKLRIYPLAGGSPRRIWTSPDSGGPGDAISFTALGDRFALKFAEKLYVGSTK